MAAVPEDSVPEAIKQLEGYDESKSEVPINLSSPASNNNENIQIGRDRSAEAAIKKQEQASKEWRESGKHDEGGLVSGAENLALGAFGVGLAKGGLAFALNVDGLRNDLSDAINIGEDIKNGNFGNALQVGMTNLVSRSIAGRLTEGIRNPEKQSIANSLYGSLYSKTANIFIDLFKAGRK